MILKPNNPICDMCDWQPVLRSANQNYLGYGLLFNLTRFFKPQNALWKIEFISIQARQEAGLISEGTCNRMCFGVFQYVQGAAYKRAFYRGVKT